MPSSDQVLLYNIEPWNHYGFGVPNFGENVGTLNHSVHRLADEIASLQLFVMRHIDASRTQPPSPNTVKRIGKMLNRVFSVFGNRAKDYTVDRVEPGHSDPSPKIWTIHPVPYFDSVALRNGWLAEFNNLTMIALTNLYQHSDNMLALTITQTMADQILIYFQEIKRLMAYELLQLPAGTADSPEFRFTEEHYTTYNPTAVTINTEAMDYPSSVFTRFTEDDIRPLVNGIPANLIVPCLAKYPVGPVPGLEGLSGVVLPEGDETIGTADGEATHPIEPVI